MEKYIINSKATVKEALVALNNLSDDALALLVIDDEKLIGTLTDGDIRRGLIAGAQLTDNVCSVMQKNFKFIRQ